MIISIILLIVEMNMIIFYMVDEYKQTPTGPREVRRFLLAPPPQPPKQEAT
jgi:hypothetical protein